MAQYTFQYILGGSGPFDRVYANNDDEARKKIAAFLEKKPGATLVSGSIEYFHTERRRVPDQEPTRMNLLQVIDKFTEERGRRFTAKEEKEFFSESFKLPKK